jgi:hypothetical protein
MTCWPNDKAPDYGILFDLSLSVHQYGLLEGSNRIKLSNLAFFWMRLPWAGWTFPWMLLVSVGGLQWLGLSSFAGPVLRKFEPWAYPHFHLGLA